MFHLFFLLISVAYSIDFENLEKYSDKELDDFFSTQMQRFFNDDYEFNKWELHKDLVSEIDKEKEHANENLPEVFFDRLLESIAKKCQSEAKFGKWIKQNEHWVIQRGAVYQVI